jgi:ParB-like chromosome segregation protein Spo0J
LLRNINISDIKSNPFQTRTAADEAEAIEALAVEIKQMGLWPGALRGRAVNGYVQLCTGHRRLEALKVLGWTQAPVEIEQLTDRQMLEQGIAENLQRRGLTDGEKLESVSRLFKLYRDQKLPRDDAIREVARITGYAYHYLRQEVLAIDSYSLEAQAVIREGKVSIREATVANRVGGSEMIVTASKKQWQWQEMEKIEGELKKIPDQKLRDKVRAKVAAGKVDTHKEVTRVMHEVAAHDKGKSGEKPDLMIIIRMWTDTINGWSDTLDQVMPYRDYIQEHHDAAKKFCEAVGPFVDKLRNLC